MKLNRLSLSSPHVSIQKASAIGTVTSEEVPRAGLVAEYRFNEGTGQALRDYGPRGFTGQLGSSASSDSNDPVWTPQGLYFVTDDVVTCGALGPIDTVYIVFHNDAEISAATEWDGLIGFTSNDTILSVGGNVSGTISNEIITVLVTTPYLTRYYYTSATDTIAAGWHTLALVWRNTYYDIILDGRSKYTGKNGTAPQASKITASSASIGNSLPVGTRSFEGTIAYVAMWDRALSTNELSKIGRIVQDNYLTQRGIDSLN
jgi:hypothetical protein